MIAYTTFLLFAIALICLIPVDTKKDRFFAAIFSVATFCVFSWFFTHALDGTQHDFSFIWNSSSSGDIKIDIISSPYNYMLILPFFVITMVVIANNNFFNYEEQKCRYTGVLLFNLIAIITMITSNNFVQLLVALFMIDILALFIIKNPASFRRFAIMNILADMMIFTVMAMIKSHVNSLDIGQILLYKRIGHHADFIVLIGLSAIAVKLGYFMFNIGLIVLKNIRLHRIINVLFLFPSVSALILLLKFHVLWRDSLFFSSYLQILCLATLIYSFWCSLLSAEFKTKIIYFSTMFFSLFVILLYFHGFIWTAPFTYLFMEMFVLCNLLYMIYFYSGRQTKILSIMHTKTVNSWGLYLSSLFMVMAIAVMTSTLNHMYNNVNRYYIWSFGILFLLSLSSLIKQIYFSKLIKNKHIPKLRLRLLPFVFLLCVLYLCAIPKDLQNLVVVGHTLAFIILCRFSPLSEVYKLYNHRWQNSDWLDYLYKYVFIKPIQFLGRILWIGIDRMFIERFVINTSGSLTNFCLRSFHHLHNSILVGAIVVCLFLMILLWISYMKGLIFHV